MSRLSDAVWELAKEKYITNPSTTYRSLAEELGVTFRTVANHAKKGNWPGARKENFNKVIQPLKKEISETNEFRAENVAASKSKIQDRIKILEGTLSMFYRKNLLSLGLVKPKTGDAAEQAMFEKAPELWKKLTGKDVSQQVLQAAKILLDLQKQERLMGGEPTERIEIVDKQIREIRVVERTAEEQQEFERVVFKIRERIEKAGLRFPEGD